MSGFNSFQPQVVVPTNSLFNLGDAQQKALQNQTSQNALADLQTARDNAAGVAAGDPTAIATAAMANPSGTQTAIGSIISADKDRREQGADDLAASASLAGGVLAMAPEQRAAAYSAGRAVLASQGHQNLGPEQYPGDAAAIALRDAALPALNQINHQFDAPTRLGVDPLGTASGGTYSGSTSPPAAGGTAAPVTYGPGGKTSQGNYQDSVAQLESSNNPQAFNKQGYAGLYQYGTGRLTDLGFYTPAPGEDPNSNQWSGTLNIPGFPEVKTLADFRQNASAQNAVHAVDMNNVDQFIAQIPGADKLNRAGLQAVAGLGGLGGVRHFVRTFGSANPYNPPDDNGTTLLDRYNAIASNPNAQLPPNPYARNGSPSQAPAQPSGSGAAPAYAAAGTTSLAAGGATSSDDDDADDGAGAASGAPGAPATYAATGTTPPPGMPAGGGPAQASGSTSAPMTQTAAGPMNLGAVPSATSASGGPAAPVQTASLTGTTGLPAVATDATSAPMSAPAKPPPLPTSGAAPVGERTLPVQAPPPGTPSLRGGPAGPTLAQTQGNPTPPLPTSASGLVGTPPASPQNQLAPIGAGAGGISAPNPLNNLGGQQTVSAAGGQPVTQNQFAGLGAPSAPTSPTSPGTQAAGQPQNPPGVAPLLLHGQYIPVPGGEAMGKILGADQAGNRVVMTMPGFVPKITQTNVNGHLIGSDPSGRIVSDTPVVDMRRTTAVKLPNGQSVVYQGGQPVGAPIGSPTYDIDVKEYQKDQDDQRADVDELAKSQESQIRLQDAANLISQGLNSGKGGQVRNDLAAYIETYAPGTSGPAVERMLHLQPAAAGQEFAKIQIKAAGQDEREAVGGRAGLGTTQLFLRANPSLELLPDANRDINNLQRVINVQQQDYLQARNAYINQQSDAFTADTQRNRYSNASHFDQQWQTQDNAHTYLGAAEAVNGKPFAQWSKGLQPGSVQRAIGVAQRAAPDASLNIGSASNVPATALTYLQNNPGLAAQFDQKYGQGTAALVLGR